MLIPWKENGRRTGLRGENSRKIHYLPELRANKSVQPPSYEYSTVFLINRPFLFNFAHFFHPISPKIRAFWGRICAGTKKISATCLTKVTDIAHFTPICRRRDPALTPVCAVFVPVLCRLAARWPDLQTVNCRMPID